MTALGVREPRSGDPRAALALEGERRVARHLHARGWRILCRRYRCRWGELDLVALDGQILVVVEVKTRTRALAGSGARAVTLGKRRRLMRAAACFAAERGLGHLPIRFDVLEVLGRGRAGRIRHLRGAFEAGGVDGIGGIG